MAYYNNSYWSYNGYYNSSIMKGKDIMKWKERLTSKVFWAELVVLIAQALKLFGIYEVPNDLLNSIQDLITVAFTVFATLNNPTTKTEF